MTKNTLSKINHSANLPQLRELKQKRVNDLSFGEIKSLYRFVLSCEKMLGLNIRIRNINNTK